METVRIRVPSLFLQWSGVTMKFRSHLCSDLSPVTHTWDQEGVWAVGWGHCSWNSYLGNKEGMWGIPDNPVRLSCELTNKHKRQKMYERKVQPRFHTTNGLQNDHTPAHLNVTNWHIQETTLVAIQKANKMLQIVKKTKQLHNTKAHLLLKTKSPNKGAQTRTKRMREISNNPKKAYRHAAHLTKGHGACNKVPGGLQTDQISIWDRKPPDVLRTAEGVPSSSNPQLRTTRASESTYRGGSA